MKFLNHSELVEFLPWSRTTIEIMINEGIFKSISNPLVKGGNRFYLREQVEDAIIKMMEDK